MDSDRFAEIKARMQSLALPERVAYEVQLAKEMGLSITPEALASIAVPTERTTRLEDDGAGRPASRLDIPDGPVLEWGGVDVDARSVPDNVLDLGPGAALHLASVQEAIRRLESGHFAGAQDLAALAALLQERLDGLTGSAMRPDLAAQAGAAIAKSLFGHVDPKQSKDGLGGAPNP